ncbi:metallophosphoesterase family protein [Romboutsia sp.]|uniref:metallophosphoesterase family protein n=1 Tax=Romboutsia sp. TaxID=1965302 RepID=UPI003F2C283B
MKFIHTSDWHLGKNLDGHSRIEEQEQFCKEFIEIVQENDVDMVIIAGDIYDTSNPTPKVEKLFYETVLKLSNNGQRCVLIISGNNDNSKKLSAANPLVYSQGIIILEDINSKLELLKYKGFEILESKESCIKLSIKGEKVTIIMLPYLSERELNEIIYAKIKDYKSKESYTKKIGDLFASLEQNFTDDSINIAIGHLKVIGCENTESERILGEYLEVDKKNLPKNAQYIALGHLHKMQRVSEYLNAYYSGSPIQYSKSEHNQLKGIYLVDIKVGKTPDVKDIYFNNYKPIEVFSCSSVKEALEICNKNKDRNIWSYFDINTEEAVPQYLIKNMKETLDNIVEINRNKSLNHEYESKNIKEKSRGEIFKEFYSYSKGVEPRGELINLFLEITNEEGESKYEAD